MNNLTNFNYLYLCMNNTLYTCIDKYNFNFSKMVIDTKLKFSMYSYIFKMKYTYIIICISVHICIRVQYN